MTSIVRAGSSPSAFVYSPSNLPVHAAPLRVSQLSHPSQSFQNITVARDLEHTVQPHWHTLRPASATAPGLCTTQAEAVRMQHLLGLFERSWTPVWQFRPWRWPSVVALAGWCVAPLRDLVTYVQHRMLDGVVNGLDGIVRAFKFGTIQTHGLNVLIDNHGQSKITGPAVWMLTHCDDPWDAFLLGALRNLLPEIPDAHGGHQMSPHVVMKEAQVWYERLVTGWLFKRHVTHLLKNRERYTDAERRAHNDQVLQQEPPQVLARGAHLILFPEGHVSGNGTIQVGPVGALKGFARGKDGPTLCMPVGVTYESLGKARTAALLNVGAPLTIDSNCHDLDTALPRDVEHALARLNTLTLSGILGVNLLRARRAGRPEILTEARLMAMLASVIDPVLAEKASGRNSQLHSVAVDEGLRELNSRRACVQLALKQLRQQGLVDAAGRFDNAKLTGNAEATRIFEATHYNKEISHRRYNSQRAYPLAFWGNRLLQQAAEIPGLI